MSGSKLQAAHGHIRVIKSLWKRIVKAVQRGRRVLTVSKRSLGSCKMGGGAPLPILRAAKCSGHVVCPRRTEYKHHGIASRGFPA